jgi:hypothetical protein
VHGGLGEEGQGGVVERDGIGKIVEGGKSWFRGLSSKVGRGGGFLA